MGYKWLKSDNNACPYCGHLHEVSLIDKIFLKSGNINAVNIACDGCKEMIGWYYSSKGFLNNRGKKYGFRNEYLKQKRLAKKSNDKQSKSS